MSSRTNFLNIFLLFLYLSLYISPGRKIFKEKNYVWLVHIYENDSFGSHFFGWGKSRNWPKIRKDVRHTYINCKAVKVNEVIEKVNSTKSGCKNHRWRRRFKKHSRASPEFQSKELNKKLRNFVFEQQINWTRKASQNANKIISKVEKLKQSNKLNENILFGKTLEAFNPETNLIDLKLTTSKYVQNCFFFSETVQGIYLQDQKKKSLAFWRLIKSGPWVWKTSEKDCSIYRNILWLLKGPISLKSSIEAGKLILCSSFDHRFLQLP